MTPGSKKDFSVSSELPPKERLGGSKGGPEEEESENIQGDRLNKEARWDIGRAGGAALWRDIQSGEEAEVYRSMEQI